MSFTKDDITVLRRAIQEETKPRFDGLREEMAENTRTIISHFNQSQGLQNGRLEHIEDELAEVHVKLDAITKMLVMRQEMHNLIRELKAHGMALDESKIFVA